MFDPHDSQYGTAPGGLDLPAHVRGTAADLHAKNTQRFSIHSQEPSPTQWAVATPESFAAPCTNIEGHGDDRSSDEEDASVW